MSEIFELAKSQSEKILEHLKESIGDAWESLPDEKKQTVETLALKIPEFRLRVLIDSDNEDLRAKLETYESAAGDWKVWTELEGEKLYNSFWGGVERTARSLGTFLGVAAGEFVSRLIPGV